MAAPERSASQLSSEDGLESKIKQLEHQLSVVTAERNDLAADVESLCMQTSGDIFSASSVLSERICNMQKEANKLQTQVTAGELTILLPLTSQQFQQLCTSSQMCAATHLPGRERD
jgi:peptidoglycan hydrolase CwlO-like protein